MELVVIWAALGVYGAGRLHDKWVEDFGKITPLGVCLCVLFAVAGPFAVGAAYMLERIDPTGRWG